MPTLGYLVLAWQFSLGIVFLLSLLPKLRRPLAFARIVAAYEILPVSLAYLFALALIPVEGFLAITLNAGWQANIALVLAVVVLLTFLMGVSINLRRGRRIVCGCFGGASDQLSLRTVARLLLLIVAVIDLMQIRDVIEPSLLNINASSPLQLIVAYLLPTWFLAAFFILVSVWMLHLLN